MFYVFGENMNCQYYVGVDHNKELSKWSGRYILISKRLYDIIVDSIKKSYETEFGPLHYSRSGADWYVLRR